MAFKLEVPIYEEHVIVNFHKNTDVLKKFFKKDIIEYIDEQGFTSKGLTIAFHKGGFYVFIDKDLKHNDLINTIAHESFHLVEFIFRHKGIKLSRKSSESWAYLIGWFTERIYEKAIKEINLEKDLFF